MIIRDTGSDAPTANHTVLVDIYSQKEDFDPVAFVEAALKGHDNDNENAVTCYSVLKHAFVKGEFTEEDFHEPEA